MPMTRTIRGRGLFGWSHLARNCLETVPKTMSHQGLSMPRARALHPPTTIPFATVAVKDGINRIRHDEKSTARRYLGCMHGPGIQCTKIYVDWRSGAISPYIRTCEYLQPIRAGLSTLIRM